MRTRRAVRALVGCIGVFLLHTSSVRAQTDVSGLIDSLISREWERHGVKPAPPSSDAEFVRRVHLDLVGVVPSSEEAGRFLRNNSPTKRAELIDRLINSPLFGDHWANVWEVQLIGRRMRGAGVTPFRTWMHDEVFAKNMPFDEFARALTVGRGQGTAAFSARHNSPNSITGVLTRTFLGVRMTCTECHDDKRGEWKQHDFWSLAAFFTPAGEVSYERRVKMGDKENVAQLQARARFLPGTPSVDATNRSLREQFAEWLTSENNPWFTKETVNRIWAHFLGRGLADPVDDFWTGMEPTHPELLEALSKELIAHRFDFKWLVRSIANSHAYQLSSKAGRETSDPMNLYFTRAEFRPLSPEQMFYSMVEAVNTAAAAARRSDTLLARKDQYLQQFISQFANDENQEEKHFEGTVAQTLMLFNGEFVNQTIKSGEPRSGLSAVFRLARNDDEGVHDLFLRTLSREPNPKEREFFKKYLGGSLTNQLLAQGSKVIAQSILERKVSDALYRSGVMNNVGGQILGGVLGGLLGRSSRNPVDATDQALRGVSRTREQLFEDLYWSLLNSTEFLYNH